MRSNVESWFTRSIGEHVKDLVLYLLEGPLIVGDVHDLVTSQWGRRSYVDDFASCVIRGHGSR